MLRRVIPQSTRAALRSSMRRSMATAAAAEKAPLQPPSSAPLNETTSPHVQALVETISRLSLLETSQLVRELKTRLNIQEAPVMMPGATAGAGPAAPAAEEKTEKPVEKTEFAIKLIKFDAAVKAKVIRELKNLLPGANLVEAKKMAESAPKVIRENVTKDEAEKIKKVLEAVGAEVALE